MDNGTVALFLLSPKLEFKGFFLYSSIKKELSDRNYTGGYMIIHGLFSEDFPDVESKNFKDLLTKFYTVVEEQNAQSARPGKHGDCVAS